MKWFDELQSVLIHFGVIEDVILEFSSSFETLLILVSKKGPSKSSILKEINDILSDYSGKLIVEVQKYSQSKLFVSSISYIEAILKSTTDDERNYLLEAIDCLRVGAKRAAVIMGWCAAIDRLHRKVESLGFDTFNQKTKEMNAKTTGRYKRFSSSFEISSLAEFRALVFDTVLLWVLEYWELIDYNQHNRLAACYVMRSNSAHPGDTIISEENLMSFFSDLRVIIFDNPVFQI